MDNQILPSETGAAEPRANSAAYPEEPDVPESFYALAVLACPVGMGLMMWFMMRGGKQPAPAANAQPAADAELTVLRAEVDQLRAEQQNRRGDLATRPVRSFGE